MKKISTFKAFFGGFSLSNRKIKVAVYLWVINLLFALTAAAPIYSLIKKDLSRSLMDDRMLEGFDFMWLGDFAHKYGDILSIFGSALLIFMVMYVLLNVVLGGGIVGRLHAADEKATVKSFLADCGRYFWRFFRLALLSIPVYLVFVGLLSTLTGLVTGMFRKTAVTEWTLVYEDIANYVILFILFTVVSMVIDYTRIHLVVNDSHKVFKGFLQAVKFVFKRFFKAWFLYLMVALIFVIFTLAYMEISTALPVNSMGLIFLTFLLQQLYVFSRVWVKLDFYAAQMVFYKGSVELPAPPPEEEAVPEAVEEVEAPAPMEEPVSEAE